MTIVRLPMLCLAALMTLTACGPDPSPKEPSPLPPVKDTFAGDMVGAMDKARGVEATTMEQKQETDRAVDEASR